MTDSFKRFAFDREYAPDGTVLRDGDRIRKVFTEAELQAAADEAAEEARRGEEAQAAAAAADALRQIAGRLQAVIARMDAESAAMREDASRLAVTAARIIAGAALDRFGEETIEACAREALSDLRGEPRVSVRVAPHLADSVAQRLYEQAEMMGFDGAVVVRADEEIMGGDCVLEWRSGAIERTAASIEARISEAVAKWLAAPPEAAPASDDENADGQSGAAA